MRAAVELVLRLACFGLASLGLRPAARAVGAHDFIVQLPGGYQHEISERGRSPDGVLKAWWLRVWCLRVW